MHLKMLSGRWRPFCLGLNVLKQPTSSNRVHINQVIGDMLWNSSRYSSSYPLPCITKGSSSHFSPSLPSFIQDTAWWLWGHKCHWGPRGTRYFLSRGPQWNQIARFMGPRWGQDGAHLGPTGPRWAPCWPHELSYLGSYGSMILNFRGCIIFSWWIHVMNLPASLWLFPWQQHNPILTPVSVKWSWKLWVNRSVQIQIKTQQAVNRMQSYRYIVKVNLYAPRTCLLLKQTTVNVRPWVVMKGINLLCPCDVIWPTLATRSHYLNQCWHTAQCILWH